MKQYAVAVSVFRDMYVKGIPVNVFTFSTAMICFCHLNCVDYAFALLAAIIKRGFVPNVVTYNTLIRGLISQDNPVEAQLLFTNLIRFKLIQPNVVTYTTIINGLCKRGHASMVVKLFKYMDKKGCKPDTISRSSIGSLPSNDKERYNAKFYAYGKEGMINVAEDVIKFMIQRGHFPDVVTYNSLMDIYCLRGEVDEALAVLQTMKTRDIVPDIRTYSI
ncbi:small ribosomal subunit protein mL103 (rPPR7)-like [Apium graveolens]|uniref:small ribosomal subunit protein mL103 (rPPR7)-like n=1 Tax=Apium graveolens TaxID=4045 RepID=UPI003D799F4D